MEALAQEFRRQAPTLFPEISAYERGILFLAFLEAMLTGWDEYLRRMALERLDEMRSELRGEKTVQE